MSSQQSAVSSEQGLFAPYLAEQTEQRPLGFPTVVQQGGGDIRREYQLVPA